MHQKARPVSFRYEYLHVVHTCARDVAAVPSPSASTLPGKETRLRRAAHASLLHLFIRCDFHPAIAVKGNVKSALLCTFFFHPSPAVALLSCLALLLPPHLSLVLNKSYHHLGLDTYD